MHSRYSDESPKQSRSFSPINVLLHTLSRRCNPISHDALQRPQGSHGAHPIGTKIIKKNCEISRVSVFVKFHFETICIMQMYSFPNKPLFLRVCSTNLLKTLWKKGEIARNEQFLLFPPCFLPFWRTFCHFHQISTCRLQILFNLEVSKIFCLGKG